MDCRVIAHCLIALGVTFVFYTATLAAEQASGWGHLRGRFVFDGEAPKPTYFDVNKDQEVCGKQPIRVEELLVDERDRGIANVVVYLRGKELPIPPSYPAPDAKESKILVTECRCEPHVALVQIGQELVFWNEDPIAYNFCLAPLLNPALSNVLTANGRDSMRFVRAVSIPTEITCNIHPWMKGWLLINDNPYMAVTDTHGQFEIKNIPAGEHEFRIWHEKSGGLAARNGWHAGKVKIKIEVDQTTDFGDVLVAPALFESRK